MSWKIWSFVDNIFEFLTSFTTICINICNVLFSQNNLINFQKSIIMVITRFEAILRENHPREETNSDPLNLLSLPLKSRIIVVATVHQFSWVSHLKNNLNVCVHFHQRCCYWPTFRYRLFLCTRRSLKK